MFRIIMSKFCASKLVFSLLCFIAFGSSAPRVSAKTVAIVQIIEHPALDSTRQGIIDTLKKTSPDTTVLWESAQGNPALAMQISQKFVGDRVDVIVGLGTIPAQAAVTVAQKKDIPVIFTSVTDPVSAKIVPQSTGVSNYVDVERQLDIMLKAMPSLKKLGTIYNPGEAFSEKVLFLLQEACRKKGIVVISAIATKTFEVGSAAKSIIDQVDAVFINNDNTVLAAFPTLVKVCDGQNKPAFSSDTGSIEQGAMVVLGPNQYKVGEQTACIIDKVLNNPTLMKEIPTVYPKSVELRVNLDKADQLKFNLDKDLMREAQIYRASKGIKNE